MVFICWSAVEAILSFENADAVDVDEEAVDALESFTSDRLAP